MKKILLILLATFAIAAHLMAQAEPAAHQKISGMWVWSDNSYKTVEQRAKLIQFCQEHQFNHLDVSVRVEKADGKMSVADTAELTDLLASAAAAHITISALRGNQRMFYQTNYTKTLGELRAMIEFNQSLPLNQRMMGVKYDVEPQTTDEWRQGGEGRKVIMQEYLGCLVKLNELLAATTNGPKLALTVDIPFWWDKAELVVEFAGHAKPFSEHVQDLTDSATLMSYRRDPEEVKKIVETKRQYAVKIGKVILPALLQSKSASPAEASISFYGLPTGDYLKARRELEDWGASEAGIGGIMHHHYASLSNALASATAP